MHPVTQAAFLDELTHIKEAGFFESIVKPIQDLTRGGNFVSGTTGQAAPEFKAWQAAQAAKAAKSKLPKPVPARAPSMVR